MARQAIDKNKIAPYKPARVYDGISEQYVIYHYYSRQQQRYVPQKERAKRGHLSYEERMAYLQELCDAMNAEILRKNNEGIFHDEDVVMEEDALDASLATWWDRALNDEGLPRSTRSTMRNALGRWNLFVQDRPTWQQTLPIDLKPATVKAFAAHMKDAGLVGKSVNMYLAALGQVLAWLRTHEVPAAVLEVGDARVKQVKNETGIYRPLTHEEKESIFKHLQIAHPHFHLYTFFIYYSSIRPKELRRLKVSDLRMDGARSSIYVPWMSSKNAQSGHVQMLGELRKAVQKLGVADAPPDWYLFSKDFKPGPQPYVGKWASDIWRRECNKINIDSTAMMYGLKHTFNVDFVNDNAAKLDWEWLRRHNRHATVQQTQEYIRSLQPYYLDETQAIIRSYWQED